LGVYIYRYTLVATPLAYIDWTYPAAKRADISQTAECMDCSAHSVQLEQFACVLFGVTNNSTFRSNAGEFMVQRHGLREQQSFVRVQSRRVIEVVQRNGRLRPRPFVILQLKVYHKNTVVIKAKQTSPDDYRIQLVI